MSSNEPANKAPLTLDRLAGNLVFGIRYVGRLVPKDAVSDGMSLEFMTQQGHDVVVPFLLSGHGRVQTSPWSGMYGSTQLVDGKFRILPELYDQFPSPLPHVNPWKIRATRGLRIVNGSSFVNSFAGSCALMALHPTQKWRGAGSPSTAPGVYSGMFLDLDFQSLEGDDLPEVVRKAGFDVQDEGHEERTFKLPIYASWSPLPDEKSGSPELLRTRPSKASPGLKPYFVPSAPPEAILQALVWAREKGRIASVGVTQLLRKDSTSNATKLERGSDLAVLRSDKNDPRIDEIGMLLERRQFLTIGGVAVWFGLEPTYQAPKMVPAQ